MNINIDINIKASEDITNSLLTLAAVLHNAVPIFNENPKVIEPKEELNIDNKELQVAKEKLEVSCQVVKEITLKEVKDILIKFSESGKSEEVKALIKSFGAAKIIQIPKEKYGELLQEVDLMN